MSQTSSSSIDLVALAEELDKEWPAERITTWLIERERKAYLFFKRRRAEVEIQNKEARAKGVSYQDRLKFGKQLDALDRLLVETTERGKAAKLVRRTASSYVQDELDAEFIHSRSFERFLRCATM